MFLRIIDLEQDRQDPWNSKQRWLKLAAQAHKVALFKGKRRCELSHVEDHVFSFEKERISIGYKISHLWSISSDISRVQKADTFIGYWGCNQVTW